MSYNKLYDTDEDTEKVILVGVEKSSALLDMESSLDELGELARTAGAVVVGRISQKRDAISRTYYVGKGKVEEIKKAIEENEATGIICDDELSSVQIKNLEQMLEVKIMDRTMLILDIFAHRASSSEGKIQVELAQLRYNLSHLAGYGNMLSRLGGGIGTRGPGEKKLEMDRRYIKDRISELKSELEEIKTHRQVMRGKRQGNNAIIVSMIGYTNAGKSTILNYYTNAGVLAEDKLFATLDTTTRKLSLPNGSEVLLTDTVGFIQKLPHQLIRAFHATLEELLHADILLHIVDSSNKNREEQMEVVYNTIKQLEYTNIPIVTVYNKIDLDVELPFKEDLNAYSSMGVSAKTGAGMENLLSLIEDILKNKRSEKSILIPYSQGHLIGSIHSKCEIISEEHTENGYLIKAYLGDELKNKLSPFILE